VMHGGLLAAIHSSEPLDMGDVRVIDMDVLEDLEEEDITECLAANDDILVEVDDPRSAWKYNGKHYRVDPRAYPYEY